MDDHFDARGHFEGANVASLSSDDAPLEVVAWQVDDRHCRLDGMLSRAALDGLGHDVARAIGGRLAGLRLESFDQVGGFPPGVGLDSLDEGFARLVRRHARDSLEFVMMLFDQRVVAGGRGGDVALELVEVLFTFGDASVALVDVGELQRQRLLASVELSRD